MVLSEAVIAAITALAVQLGFQKISQQKGKDGIVNITAISPNGEEVTLVGFKNEALGSPQYDLKKLTAAVNKRDPNNPTYKITNDSSVDKRIFALAFVPVDANTKTQGIVEIWLNEKRLFPISVPAAGMLDGVVSLNIPIPPNFGLNIQESKSLEVYLYSGDASAVAITFGIFIANMK